MAGPEGSLTVSAAVVRPPAGGTHEVGFLQLVSIGDGDINMVKYLLCRSLHRRQCWLVASWLGVAAAPGQSSSGYPAVRRDLTGS